MAATEITSTSIPHTHAGLNLTDASFTTMTSGASNGVKFDWVSDQIVVLKMTSGAASETVFTLHVRVPAPYTTYGCAVTNPTILLQDDDVVFLRLEEIFKDSNGETTITCDTASQCKILVLAP